MLGLCSNIDIFIIKEKNRVYPKLLSHIGTYKYIYIYMCVCVCMCALIHHPSDMVRIIDVSNQSDPLILSTLVLQSYSCIEVSRTYIVYCV
jgi:hypothetical protein